ncbi:MAG: hypothetical protein EOP48_09335 [Sphingobacteriales bacterium]|nr:MAG: hypothetical protein EOP48_09335 [Sphingobacteriales bacterium]
METSQVKAVIATVGTILGSILTVLTKDYIENRNLVFVSFAHRKSLNWVWTGEIKQGLGASTALKLRVDLKIKTGLWIFYRTGKIYMEDSNMSIVNLKGAFRNYKFFKISYENRSSEVVQFGSFVFSLSDVRNKVVGMFVGYGYINEKGACRKAAYNKPASG